MAKEKELTWEKIKETVEWAKKADFRVTDDIGYFLLSSLIFKNKKEVKND